MFLGFVFIISGLGSLMILERIFPDRKLPHVPGWWLRVLAINISQLCIVVLGAYTWERWLNGLVYPQPLINPTAPFGHKLVSSIFTLKDYVDPALGGFIAYLVNSYIFYWFHRARHDIYLFWILFHQVHHSPQRIEVITSFYKHPLEILVDSVLMTFLLYPILGLSKESSIWLSIFSAYGEYFYHMNIKLRDGLVTLFSVLRVTVFIIYETSVRIVKTIQISLSGISSEIHLKTQSPM